MKTSFIVGLVIFWSATLVLGVAGLVSYENQKLVKNLQSAGNGSTTPNVLAQDSVVQEAVQSGATTWNQELVASHNSLDDCWLTINGKIYNVTEYVPFHPGGTQTILNTCGKEATEAFRTKGGEGDDHSKQAYALLDNYFLADVGAPLPSLTEAPLEVVQNTETIQPSSGTPTKTEPEKKPTVTPTKPATVTPTPQSTGLTASTVAKHNTTADCWIIVNKKVYNVTQYIPFHPGGTNTIRPWCGKESTDAFSTKGGAGGNHSSSAWKQLENYYVGTLGASVQAVVPTTPVTPPSVPVTPAPAQTGSVALTASTVSAHSTTNDCWIIVNNSVYNITEYIPFHPGGTNTIRPWCGKESTNAFTTRGGNGRHSSGAWSQLENYRIGSLGGSTSVVTPVVTTPPSRNDDDDDDDDD
jgi:cytochrome b involved in lipid metabolism